MVTAGAGMSVESTSPAAMSTAAGVVAIVLAPRAAVNTEGEDVRRRRFRTEPAVAARTVAAADRVSGRAPPSSGTLLASDSRVAPASAAKAHAGATDAIFVLP